MLKTVLKVFGGLVVLLLVTVGGLLLKAGGGLTKIRDIPIRPISVVSDSSTMARGRHLATAIMKCSYCHGPDFGGQAPFVDAGLLGVVNTPNLTHGKGGRIGG